MTKKTDTPAIRFKGYSDTWEQRKFSELYEKVSRKNDLTYGKDDIISVANMYFKADSYITDESYLLTYNIFELGDIAFEGNKSKNYAHGRFVENTIGNGIVSHVFDVFKPIMKPYDLQFWKYAINNEQLMGGILLRSTKASTMMTNLVANDFLQETFLVPAYPEQQKIGAFFQELDRLITLHQRKYEKLHNIKKSMLEKMFPKNGSNVPEIRFKGFTEAWEQRKVREVTDRYDNLRIPVAASLRVAGTTPYYGANGNQDYVDGYTHDGEFILVAEDGANDLKNYPVKCVKGRIWVNNHAHVLQGKYDCADNQFLAYAISQADIESLLVGGGRAKLNAETLMGIDLLLPNKAEQIRIGKYLAQLDNLITLHQRELEKLQNIKKSMLEKMFV